MLVEQTLDKYENGSTNIAQNEHVRHDDVGAPVWTINFGVQQDFTRNAETNASNGLNECKRFGDGADIWFDLGIVAAGIEWRQAEQIKCFQIFCSCFNEVHVW